MEQNEYKDRLLRVLKPIGQIVLIGIAYFIFIKLTGWSIPCPIRWITGKHCPGCGITRMMLAMLRLDFHEAMRQNCLLFFLLPIFLFYGIWKGINYVKSGKDRLSVPEQIAIILLFIVVVAFWIMRNMQEFSFLAPR